MCGPNFQPFVHINGVIDFDNFRQNRLPYYIEGPGKLTGVSVSSRPFISPVLSSISYELQKLVSTFEIVKMISVENIFKTVAQKFAIRCK